MKQLDKEQLQKIVEKAEKLANSVVIDQKQAAILKQEIDQLLKPAKYFQRIL